MLVSRPRPKSPHKNKNEVNQSHSRQSYHIYNLKLRRLTTNKQAMKLLIPLLTIGAVVGAPDSSLRHRELGGLKTICMYLGRKYGFQSFDIPSDKYRFFTSDSRFFPAEPGECDPEDVKSLSSDDLETKKFCRLFKHNLNEWWTTDAISAATDWMLANDFETGACTNKNTYGTLHMEHVKEINNAHWEDLYDDLVDLLLNFTYDELLDAEDCLYGIWDGNYTDNRDYRDYQDSIEDVRTCRDGSVCTSNSDCHKGGSCQNRNDRRK